MSAKNAKMPNVPVPGPESKFIQVMYRSDGNVDVASNGMTVFDLWALAQFLRMRADEMYITTQTQNRMREQVGSGIEIARTIPGPKPQ